jgi:hypothetical protein
MWSSASNSKTAINGIIHNTCGIIDESVLHQFNFILTEESLNITLILKFLSILYQIYYFFIKKKNQKI